MNVITPNWVAVGLLQDIPKRGARCVRNGTMTIAVFRTEDDRVFALEDRCPHRAGPLSQGIVHDGCVTCPLHNWVISLATGAAMGADVGMTKTFACRLDRDRILIDLTCNRQSVP